MTIGDLWRSSPRGKYKKTPKGSKSTRKRRLRDLREAAAAFKGRGRWLVTEESSSLIVLRRVDLDTASLRKQQFGQATQVTVQAWLASSSPNIACYSYSVSSVSNSSSHLLLISHPISSSHLM